VTPWRHLVALLSAAKIRAVCLAPTRQETSPVRSRTRPAALRPDPSQVICNWPNEPLANFSRARSGFPLGDGGAWFGRQPAVRPASKTPRIEIRILSLAHLDTPAPPANRGTRRRCVVPLPLHPRTRRDLSCRDVTRHDVLRPVVTRHDVSSHDMTCIDMS
jgi:hypothetical protein